MGGSRSGVPEWLRRYWYPTIKCAKCPLRHKCNCWEEYKKCDRA